MFYEFSGGCIVFAGHFNCPGDFPDRVDSRLDVLLSCYNLVAVNDGPTHLHHNGLLNKLDLMFECESDRRLSEVKTVIVGFSDHRLLKARLRCHRVQTATATYSYRDYKRMDIVGLRRFLLSRPSWTSPASDPNVVAAQLDVDLQRAIDKFAPVRTRSKRPSQSKSPWLTTECVAAKRDRRRLERQFARTKSDEDRVAYRRVCRSTNKLFRDARSSYVRHQLDEKRDNPRQLWKTVKALLHPGQQRQWFEGQNTEQLASSISAFFANKLRSVKTSVAAGLASAIGGVDVCPPPQLPISTMSSFDPVDPIEVERIINQLQPKTSPLDIVPVSVMKLCKAELSVVIANLANLSFTSGCFPTMMKIGWVTPLLKKAGLDVTDFKNFRPITNLSTISKLLERLAHNRLKQCITASPNFSRLQSAYRQGHSTETALTKIMDDIFGAIDDGSVVALMSLDISAAFDAVNHDVLIQRLEDEFGIAGMCGKWIRSYFN